MSDTENRTPEEEQQTEDEPSTDTAASADLSDPVAADEGDPPIIVQGGGSGTAG